MVAKNSSKAPHRGGQPVAIVGTTLALGMYWMLIEQVRVLGSQPPIMIDPVADFARFLRYLPWQLAIFGLLGLALAALIRFAGISRGWVPWLRFGGALFLFLVPSAAIGTYRSSRDPFETGLTILAVGGGIALGIWALAALGRLLPLGLRTAWPTASVLGGSLLVVPVLSRASAPLRHGSLGMIELLGMAQPLDAITAAAVAGTLLLARALRRSGIRGAAAAGALWLPTAMTATPEVARGQPERRPSDVLLVLIDALRPDVLGAYGRSPSLTPGLDAVAAESVVFERAYAASNRTKRSMPPIMTSLPAAVVGEVITEKAVTLAERLREAGYATYGISANPTVSEFYGYRQGFEGFHDPTTSPDYLIMNPLKIAGRIFAGRAYRWNLISAQLYYPTAWELASRAKRILTKTPRPLFLYMHTMDLHGPYLPPKRFLPLEYRSTEFISYYDLLASIGDPNFGDAAHRRRLANARQRYEAELRFIDEQLSGLIAALKSSGRWEETLVWIVSDHGEAFGEHGWAGHAGFNVYSTLLHVPLLLKPPRSSDLEPTVVEAPVSTADLLPTTLSMLRLEPAETTFGIDLSESRATSARPASKAIVADVDFGKKGRLLSTIDGRWKLDLMLAPDSGLPEPRALFDLESDPLETRNLLTARPEIAQRLTDAIVERLEQERRLSLKPRTKALDPALQEQLRNLGYVD